MRAPWKILRDWFDGKSVQHTGEHYQFDLAPPRITTRSGKAPYFYFGGLSEDARDTAAQGADVYLMWPDTLANSKAVVDDMNMRAATYGRTLKHGFRVHVVVRETETEARAAADRLLSKLDADTGAAIRAKSLDSTSTGVAQQAALREAASANDGYIEDNLWTGIGRARSGCGAAIVGDPDQVLAKINAYRDIGFEAFILSGYPHAAECDLFGRYVLPSLEHGLLTI
jgi:alkanesulfonate monooxygenase